MTLDPQALFYALLGGILPALLWLWFWLKEDARRPEPRGMIMLSFFAGMLAVAIAFPAEKYLASIIAPGTTLLSAWAVTEEFLKLAAFALLAARSRYFDEPIDAFIYMVTVALGFAALENTLFLISPLIDGELLASVVTGNLRYIGPTLLHVAASGIIGISIGAAFYKNAAVRAASLIAGFFAASVLHLLFNFFILSESDIPVFLVYLTLWFVIVALIFLLERIKKIKRKKFL